MDAQGHIYMVDSEQVSAEDAARLDGYLRGRAEELVLEKMKALAEIEAAEQDGA